MKKLSISLLLLLMGIQFAQAQNKEEEEKPKNGWTSTGDISLLFNQAAFNAEWRGGGTSNYAGNLTLNYDLNYKKDEFTWETKFLGDYGLTKSKDDPFTRKTNDRLEINSIAGYQIKASKWAYSFFANIRTQFAKGYQYSEEEIIDDAGNVTGSETVRTETTHFLSPGYLQFGPGMLYDRGKKFKLNLAPATSRFIFVDDQFTTVPGYTNGDYFGVDQGETSRYEFGASISVQSDLKLVKNVSLQNLLNLYSNYLEDPQNVDLDYTVKLNMKVNDYISANFIFQTIYDDNAVAAFQVREVLGVGLSYNLNPDKEE